MMNYYQNLNYVQQLNTPKSLFIFSLLNCYKVSKSFVFKALKSFVLYITGLLMNCFVVYLKYLKLLFKFLQLNNIYNKVLNFLIAQNFDNGPPINNYHDHYPNYAQRLNTPQSLLSICCFL